MLGTSCLSMRPLNCCPFLLASCSYPGLEGFMLQAVFVLNSLPQRTSEILCPPVGHSIQQFQFCDAVQTEGQLYHMLLDERMKFARGIGTAPYAICGNETIKKIALIRPSTKARLANIDGVNQVCLTIGMRIFIFFMGK
ncbi:hypothetical protein CK203_072590 [Vitis vinifera]|uniref:HRDC domain-containing protein n=1 Tax=Vitis vinifera TaxID=29760 RepID=A0A438F8W2_VITVI|nr:hypothetical protein CK203_072590 [Vitis vinifera]